MSGYCNAELKKLSLCCRTKRDAKQITKRFIITLI